MFLVSLLPHLVSASTTCQSSSKAGSGTKFALKCIPRKASGTKQPAAADSADDRNYIGADACRDCHTTTPESYEQGLHAKGLMEICGVTASRVCETCHGPARVHLQTGGDTDKIVVFRTLTNKEVNKPCLGCHELGKSHNAFLDPEQAGADKSCLSWHTVHHPAKPK